MHFIESSHITSVTKTKQLTINTELTRAFNPYLFRDEAGIWDGGESVGDGDEWEEVVSCQRVRQLPVTNSWEEKARLRGFLSNKVAKISFTMREYQ